MAHCDWNKLNDFSSEGLVELKCKNCGCVILAKSETVLKRCALSPTKEPSTIVQAANYVQNIVTNVINPDPRSQEEIDRLFSICQSCEFYALVKRGAGYKGKCLKCGCNINQSPSYVYNKLASKKVSCPEGKW